MKCPKCQSELVEGALYCSSCGMKIERCQHCQNVLLPNANYCSHCGKAVNTTKTQYQPIHGEYQNRLGGYYQPLSDSQAYQKETVVKEDVDFKNIPADKKVNKRIIVLSVIALIVSTALAWGYLLKTENIDPFIPGDSATSDPIKIKSENDPYATIGNTNQGGHVTVYKNRLYVCDDDGRLVSMSTSFVQ